MTKEEKKIKRLERAYRRKAKRIEKDIKYFQISKNFDEYSLSWGRKYLQGRIFICEMRYSSCEQRGYCNGDC